MDIELVEVKNKKCTFEDLFVGQYFINGGGDYRQKMGPSNQQDNVLMTTSAGKRKSVYTWEAVNLVTPLEVVSIKVKKV